MACGCPGCSGNYEIEGCYYAEEPDNTQARLEAAEDVCKALEEAISGAQEIGHYIGDVLKNHFEEKLKAWRDLHDRQT